MNSMGSGTVLTKNWDVEFCKRMKFNLPGYPLKPNGPGLPVAPLEPRLPVLPLIPMGPARPGRPESPDSPLSPAINENHNNLYQHNFQYNFIGVCNVAKMHARINFSSRSRLLQNTLSHA